MTCSSRFTALTISIMTVFALSACQPKVDNKSDDNETVTEAIATQSVAQTPVSEANTDEEAITDNANNTSVDMARLTEDYTKAMSRMNDEIMIGMSYNDPDTAFAKSMLGLYRGAISMAELQLKYGSDQQMRQLAQRIIDSQSEKIGVMNKWLASHPDIANPKPNTEAMQQGYADIVGSMNYRMRLGINAATADLAFARAMLPHQLATVAIAKEQLRYGTDVEMRRAAVQLTKEQPSIIAPLQAWLEKNDSTPVNIDFEQENAEEDSLAEENLELAEDIDSETKATN